MNTQNVATQEFRDGLERAENALDMVSTSLVNSRNQLVKVYEELTTNMLLLRNIAIAMAEEESNQSNK